MQTKGILLAVISALATLALATMFRSSLTAPVAVADVKQPAVIPPAGVVRQGCQLFMQNCAHCHGIDARGGEGPDLHGVSKSDQRIAAIIEVGIPGEMPKFGAKLTHADVQALIAFVRSLNRTEHARSKSSQR